MFCPECGAEYREGFITCADCEVALVPALPPEEHPDIELETVFDSTNPALIGIAKTVLESAEIDFFAVGENAASVAFSGNPFLGHVRIQVDKSRADEAKALLTEIAESDEPLEDESPSTS